MRNDHTTAREAVPIRDGIAVLSGYNCTNPCRPAASCGRGRLRTRSARSAVLESAIPTAAPRRARAYGLRVTRSVALAFRCQSRAGRNRRRWNRDCMRRRRSGSTIRGCVGFKPWPSVRRPALRLRASFLAVRSKGSAVCWLSIGALDCDAAGAFDELIARIAAAHTIDECLAAEAAAAVTLLSSMGRTSRGAVCQARCCRGSGALAGVRWPKFACSPPSPRTRNRSSQRDAQLPLRLLGPRHGLRY